MGGATYVRDVQRLFRRSTIVDSQPFFKALKAQRAVIRDGALRWEGASYQGRSELGRLLRHNVTTYGEWIENAYDAGRQTSMLDVLERALLMRGRGASTAADDPRQTALPLAVNDIATADLQG